MNAKIIIGVLTVSIMMISSAFAADIDKLAGKVGVGAFGTIPTVRLNFTDIFSAQLGLGYQTPSSNAIGSRPDTVNSLLLLSFKTATLGEGGKNAMTWGILGRYTSNVDFTSGNTSSKIGLTLGYETLVNPSFIVGITLIPVQYVSNVWGGGTVSGNNWGFLNEAVVTGHILL